MAKEFSSEKEAKEYGKNFNKYDFEKVKIDGKDVFLCGTDLPYEEDFFNFASELIEKFGLISTDEAGLRDALIESFEKYTQTKFVTVCDEY